jgi:rhodanese-related sulfurtransferase
VVNELDVAELNGQLDGDKAPLLLDIRSEAEVMHGVLPQARFLPMHLIPLRLQDLPKDRPVVLYCRTGARSYHACMFMMQHGFRNVWNLRGGIMDWARNGLPILPPTPNLRFDGG